MTVSCTGPVTRLALIMLRQKSRVQGLRDLLAMWRWLMNPACQQACSVSKPPRPNTNRQHGTLGALSIVDLHTRIPWLAGIVQCSPWANTLRCTSYRASCIRATNSRQCGFCSAYVGSSQV